MGCLVQEDVEKPVEILSRLNFYTDRTVVLNKTGVFFVGEKIGERVGKGLRVYKQVGINIPVFGYNIVGNAVSLDSFEEINAAKAVSKYLLVNFGQKAETFLDYLPFPVGRYIRTYRIILFLFLYKLEVKSGRRYNSFPERSARIETIIYQLSPPPSS